MSIYENNKCPVCGSLFADGDDIVTCPECGTPHHRECYKELGRCANKKLHGTDFVYKRNENPAAEQKASAAEAPLNINSESEDKPKECRQCGAEIPKNSFTCPECGNHQIDIEINADKLKNLYNANLGKDNSEFEKSEEMLDDVKLSDAAAVVAVNQMKFLPKFKKNKKVNWNWSAFFFGPLYLFFRKMYMPGAVIVMLELACRFIVSAIFAERLTPVLNAMNSLYASSTLSTAEMQAAAADIMAMPEYSYLVQATLIICAVTLVISTITAMLFDSLYRKRVIKIVKSVDEKVNMGESFSLVGPIMGMESSISQNEMRRMFLSRQGGVSAVAPIIAILALMMFSNLLSLFV